MHSVNILKDIVCHNQRNKYKKEGKSIWNSILVVHSMPNVIQQFIVEAHKQEANKKNVSYFIPQLNVVTKYI